MPIKRSGLTQAAHAERVKHAPIIPGGTYTDAEATALRDRYFAKQRQHAAQDAARADGIIYTDIYAPKAQAERVAYYRAFNNARFIAMRRAS